jgi:hypothetical protein
LNWANFAILEGLLLGKTFSEQGLRGMKLGSVMTIGDVPFYYYTDADGDQVALPTTERLIPESIAAHVISQSLMPVLSIRGRPEVRLGSFNSLGGGLLAGPWAPVGIEPDKGPEAAAAIDSAADGVPEEPTVEAFEAQAAAEADSELDALLADLQRSHEQPGTSASLVDQSAAEGAEPSASEPDESAAGDDADLDALLAGLTDDDDQQASTGDEEMDPDLAELLASL